MEGIFARVRDGAFGSGAREDARYVAGLREAVCAAVEYVLAGIEPDGEEQTGPIPVALLEQARRAARAGVSLDTVVRRYVVGHTLLGEFAMQEVNRHGFPAEREALPALMRVQASILNRLLQAVTGEYAAELARSERSPEQRLAEQVRKLLEGDEALGRLEFDYELGGWHLALIATGSDAAPSVHALAARLDRRVLCVAHGEDTVWAWLGGRERLAFAEVERALAAVGAAQGALLALGEPASGLGGWRLSHRQAQSALAVALRIPKGLTRYADVALLAAVLEDTVLAGTLTSVYLVPLEDSHNRGPMLRRTLRTYLDSERSVSSTASALGVARSTVENRLRTIEERLGRSLRQASPELEIALRMQEVGLPAADGSVGGTDSY